MKKVDYMGITLYGVKSERRNAKCNYKMWQAWPAGEKRIKKLITADNIAEMGEWLKRNEYTLYRMVIYYGDISLTRFYDRIYYAPNDILNQAKLFAEMMNAHSTLNGFLK